MISLLIETSSERGAISLFKEDHVLYQKALPFGFQNSKNLFPEIQSAFKECAMRLADLGLIIAGIGPGSYTGMRVGAMAAKTLSYSLKLPLVGVCSLDGFVSESPGLFASLIDAKTGGVYMQIGSMEDGKLHVLKGPALYSLEAALLELKEVKTIITPNSRLLKPKLERFGYEGRFVERDPDTAFMCRAAHEKYQQKEFSLDGGLELLYLRGSTGDF